MTTFHPNPHLIVQQDEEARILHIAGHPEKSVRVYREDHPLLRADNPSDVSLMAEGLPNEEIELLQHVGFLSRQPFPPSESPEWDWPSSFVLTILPTLNCNNACVYCYQDHRRQPRMDGRDWASAAGLVARKLDEGVSRLSISVMGGEPLLELKPLLDYLTLCRGLCENGGGAALSVSLTTNGRLLGKPGVCRRLLDASVRGFQVTLDGPALVHDGLRGSISGKPTWHEVAAGVRALRSSPETDIECAIRINMTRRCADRKSFREHLDVLRDLVGGDARFMVSIHRAADLGGTPDSSQFLGVEEYATLLPELMDMVLEAGLLINDAFYYAGGRSCYAGRANALSLLPGGRLVRCTAALDAPDNQVGRLLEDGTPVLNANDQLWVVRKPQGQCGDCASLPICRGNPCPLVLLRQGEPSCPLDLSMPYMAWLRKNDSNRSRCGLGMQNEAGWCR